MPRIRISLTLTCLVVVPLLTACVHGTSGSSNIQIDPAEARTLFTGSAPLAKNGVEIRSEVRQLLATISQSPHAALHVTDAPLFTTGVVDLISDPLPERVTSRCIGSGCTVTVKGVSVPLTPDNLFFGDEDIRAMMVHRQIPLAHGTASGTRLGVDLDVYSYGGWMRHNVFGVHELVMMPGVLGSIGLYYGMSNGIASNTAPTGGSAHWSGVMVGMDNAGRDRGNVIQGNAGIKVDFDTLDADVAFTNVHDLTVGTARNGNIWNDAPITSRGTFSGTNGRGEVEGRFYGPDHEEAGGIFEYDGITGAFGASRD